MILLQLAPELHASFVDVIPNSAELIGTKQLHPRSMTARSSDENDAYLLGLMQDATTMLQTGATYSVLVTEVMRDLFAVKPQAALGYSLGVLTMMYATGMWSVEDNQSALLQQSPIFKRRLSGALEAVREYWGIAADDPEPLWRIFVLKADVEEVKAAVGQQARVFLTHINTSTECVIAGYPPACEAVIAALDCQAVVAPYNHVLHCPPTLSESAELRRLNHAPIRNTPDITYHFKHDSPLDAIADTAIAEKITEVVTQQVDFPALVQQAHSAGARIFLELGPRSGCTRWIRDILKRQPHVAVGINRTSKDDRTGIVLALAQLVSHGVNANLASLYAPLPRAEKKKKKLVRTVSLLNRPIREAILTPENRAFFQAITVKAVAAPAKTVEIPLPTPTPLPPITVPKRPQPMISERVESDMEMIIEETKEEAPIVNKQTNGHAPLPPASFTPHPSDEFILTQLEALAVNNSHALQIHERFLRDRKLGMERMAALVQRTFQSVEPNGLESPLYNTSREIVWQDPNRPNNYSQPDHIIWDKADLEGYASGSIVPMFGDEYAIIDTYRRRTRLPMHPYLLVHRVTKIDAERGNFSAVLHDDRIRHPVRRMVQHRWANSVGGFGRIGAVRFAVDQLHRHRL